MVWAANSFQWVTLLSIGGITGDGNDDFLRTVLHLATTNYSKYYCCCTSTPNIFSIPT